MKTSRRSFIKSGTALVCTSGGIFHDNAFSESIIQYPKSDIEIGLDSNGIAWRLEYPHGDARRYGVIGGGEIDDHAAISFGLVALQSSGGGTLTLPPGSFRLGKPISLASNVELKGSGPSTRLLCDGSAEKGIGRGLVILFGSMDAAAFTDAAYVELQAADYGQTSVNTIDPADCGKFVAGGLVWIWSSDGYRDAGELLKPRYQQINKVLSINKELGIIQLENPLYAPITRGYRLSQPSDARSRVFTGPFMTERASLTNLSVSAAGKSSEAWMRFGGAYKAYIDNITIENSNVCFSANGFAHSTIRNIRGSFGRKITDIAYFCHDNVFEDFVVTADPQSTQSGWGIRFSEGAHHNVVQNLKASVANICRSGGVIVFGQGSHDNSVINADIDGDAANVLVSGRNSASSNMTHDRNNVRNCYLKFKRAKNVISNIAVDAKQRIGMRITESRFEVSRLADSLIFVKSSGTQIIDCAFQTDRGAIKLRGNSEPPIILGNSFSTTPDIVADKGTVRRIKSENSLPNAD